MIKGVLFDLDGVLFNTEEYFYRTATEYLDLIDSPLPRERAKLLICADTSIDIYDEIIRGYEDKVDKQKLREGLTRYMDDKFPYHCEIPFEEMIFPDVKPALQWLKDNDYRIACVSRSYMDYILYGLDRAGITGYFDVIVSGRDFKRNKPDPECYLYGMEKCGLERDECLIIEDSPNGIKSARNAGIAVAIRRDHVVGLDQRGADYYLDSYDELPGIIKDIDSRS